MNDQAFLKWFAETGHEWRGWPEWDKWELGFESGWFRRLTEVGVIIATVLTAHEAACLIRDFLDTELAKGRVYIVGQTSSGAYFISTKLGFGDAFYNNRNAAIADAVEARMKEEGK